MEQKQITAAYAEAVRAIKEAILESRYRAARLVNKEVLALYYAIGGYISVQSRTARWGTNAIGTISELLQQELPGLRGFSETSIHSMHSQIRLEYSIYYKLYEYGFTLYGIKLVNNKKSTQIIFRIIWINFCAKWR
jgi:hypothetical protein